MFSYHDRWEKLTQSDFEKMSYDVYAYNRGFYRWTEAYLMRSDYKQLDMPEYYVDESVTEAGKFNQEAEYYLQKMKDFCEDKDIQLVLIKAPMEGWTSGIHNAVQQYADESGIAFFDFNYVPYIDEISYDHAVDSWDGVHMNYWGAEKLSSWLGMYLVDVCGVSDVREDSRYAFLGQEAIKYDEDIARDIGLTRIDNLTDYLS